MSDAPSCWPSWCGRLDQPDTRARGRGRGGGRPHPGRAAWQRAGLEVDVWDAAARTAQRGRPAAGRGGGRSLMFCGHTDVVGGEPERVRAGRARRPHARPRHERHEGRHRGRTRGRRAAGGRRRPAGDVLVACVIDEEWASLGAEALVERYRADAAVLPEQTDLDVDLRPRRVRLVRRDRAEGVEAAGGGPDPGVDGIALAGPLLTGIVGARPRVGRADRDRRRDEAAPTSTPRRSSGGHSYPSYPAECVIGVERCLMPGESVAESLAEMAGCWPGAGPPTRASRARRGRSSRASR